MNAIYRISRLMLGGLVGAVGPLAVACSGFSGSSESADAGVSDGADDSETGTAEDSGHSEVTPFACADAGTCLRVFVTRETIGGDMGSISFGNTFCATQAAALDAGAGTTWIPWLSPFNGGAISRVGEGEWIRLDGTPAVAIHDGGITVSQPINIDETGAPLATQVWTGTGPDGHDKYQCGNWKNAASIGTVGSSNAKDDGWTAFSDDACEKQHSLYCFEKR